MTEADNDARDDADGMAHSPSIIWNRALTKEEISELNKDPFVFLTPFPLSWWHRLLFRLKVFRMRTETTLMEKFDLSRVNITIGWTKILAFGIASGIGQGLVEGILRAMGH